MCHLYLFPIPKDRCVIWDDSALLGLCNIVILTQYLVSRALVVLLSRKLARLWSLVSMKSHWLQASATWLLRGLATILLIRDFSLVCHFWCLCSFLLVVLFVWHELAATTCNRVVALNNIFVSLGTPYRDNSFASFFSMSNDSFAVKFSLYSPWNGLWFSCESYWSIRWFLFLILWIYRLFFSYLLFLFIYYLLLP